ncbi:MAG TPA: type IVB secretion system lipoprotein DotD [Gammaproteobacteria bacterium]|nr:type IVB secretion system lipoprotein DotD [Gammaproteobacteria bacterium]
MKIKLLVVSLMTILLLQGCTRSTKVVAYYPPDAGTQNARTKLTEAATSVSASLNELAAIEKATHPKAKLAPPLNPDSIGLGAPTSVDWTGPVEPLVAKLAAAGNYKFRVVGKNPNIPVLVAVYAVNMPIADILRDANYQAGKKADIVIYPSRRTIELRYRYS